MSDLDWERGLTRDALAGFVDEEIEACHYALRERGFEDSWRKGPNWIRRHLFASDHPKDHTGTYNVVAVTRTRVMVFNAKPKAPLLKVRRKIAEWPRGAVQVVWKGRDATAHYNQGASSDTRRIVRATFRWEGEDEPLVLDFPKGPLTHEVLEAVRGGTRTETRGTSPMPS